MILRRPRRTKSQFSADAELVIVELSPDDPGVQNVPRPLSAPKSGRTYLPILGSPRLTLDPPNFCRC
jgi:hypothetical protein